MIFEVTIHPCRAGAHLPLVPGMGKTGSEAHIFPAREPFPGEFLELGAGWFLEDVNGGILFRIDAMAWLPSLGTDKNVFYRLCPILRAEKDFPAQETMTVRARKNGYSLACITLSDKGAAGKREDLSGPLIGKYIGETLHICLCAGYIVPDEAAALRSLLVNLAHEQHFDIICTTGGTGIGPRDITPETTESVLDAVLPGFSQAMLLASLKKTPNAIISRAICGIMGKTLVINLPGSMKAVRENLEAILPALDHALAKIHGDATDCGG